MLCGVSHAAPYSHFRTKEDLLKTMQDYVTDQFTEVLKRSIEPFIKSNDPYMLIQMGKSYVMFFIDNPHYFQFLFSQPSMTINLSLTDNVTDNFPPFELLKAVAFRVLGETQTSQESLEDAIISLWATVHGLASIATMKNVTYDKSWESKIEAIIWNK